MSARPLTDTLRHIGGGVFIDVASDKMAELVSAVDATGKKGKLMLEISVKKATRGGAMHVSAKVKLDLPAAEPMEALLFATPDGYLVPDNPHQQTLDLKSVPDTAVMSNLKIIA